MRNRTLNPARRAQFKALCSRKGLCVSRRLRKPHAKFSHLRKHKVAVQQKRIAIYAFSWHCKAYIKRRPT